MQEPAKAPADVTRQVDAMKHESTVYQFQSICLPSARARSGASTDLPKSCSRFPCLPSSSCPWPRRRRPCRWWWACPCRSDPCRSGPFRSRGKFEGIGKALGRDLVGTQGLQSTYLTTQRRRGAGIDLVQLWLRLATPGDGLRVFEQVLSCYAVNWFEDGQVSARWPSPGAHGVIPLAARPGGACQGAGSAPGLGRYPLPGRMPSSRP